MPDRDQLERFFAWLHRSTFEDDMETSRIVYQIWEDELALLGALKLCHDHKQPMPPWLSRGLLKMWRKL